MKKVLIISAFIASTALTGCATAGLNSTNNQIALPSQLNAPAIIEDNSGAYMSPYTSDDVVAEWVDNAVKAQAGAAAGSAIGGVAGQVATEQLLGGLGVFGSLIGDSAGKAIGRDLAIKNAGGMEVIKNTSDISFNSWQDLSVYMYVSHSHRENYADVLAATKAIYTELSDGGYENSLRSASIS